ncbi:MAG: BLUF domain-containing protein [Lysobacter sp.]|nr:MAG: BLUF domain-containing protein [Lysobacter sp.]
MVNALVYASSARPSLTDAELDVLLLHSRTLNALRGITGVLIKDGVAIVQYLEGPADAVERTFARIAASPHHHDVQVLARASDVTRRFDTWHMAFKGFQRQYRRMDDTGTWIDALDEAQAGEPANVALSILVARWNAMVEARRE